MDSNKKTVTLKPKLRTATRFSGWDTLSIPAIANEPCLFSSTPEKAREKGGPLVREILDTIGDRCKKEIYDARQAGLHPIVDVRVQRLMPGMYPSIPGWHCDAVPRPYYHAQPQFDLINPASFHVTVLASTDPAVSNTRFLCNAPIDFTFNCHQPVWKQLHEQLQEQIDQGTIPSRNLGTIQPGELVVFDSYTPHKAMPTLKRGWRLFFRYSMYHNPPIENGIPNVQQVYVLSQSNGW